jgi:MOSC domain-containing protein YiiM
METLERVDVSVDSGVDGDFRGRVKPGGRGRRQVTLIERADWDAAIREVGAAVPWSERRANLLVDGIDLPQLAGARLRIGESLVLEITGEDDPCVRMDAVVPGLFAALIPDWRGGACARVKVGGTITVGDSIEIDLTGTGGS